MTEREINELIPEILSLNPAQLIEWCKGRKKLLGISNLRLSELSNVPVGTIDRIMSGGYNEFRYSSIQPIIGVLIGFDKDTPQPDHSDDSQSEFYYDTIEGYKLIVENKNHEIEELKRLCEMQAKEIEFLKRENSSKATTLENYHQHVVWMQKLIDGSMAGRMDRACGKVGTDMPEDIEPKEELLEETPSEVM